MTRGLDSFKKWAKREYVRRGILCHFYMPEIDKQYYDKADYAHFNLFSDSQDWLVKGTPGHGIKSKRGKRSYVPCLNCFEVNAKFLKALKKMTVDEKNKFELGLLLNKRKLRSSFEVIDVSTKCPIPRPPLNECHKYDIVTKRFHLYPFNYCDVVRIVIHSDIPRFPIVPIYKREIMGMLVKRDDYRTIKKRLKSKGMKEVEIFPLL